MGKIQLLSMQEMKEDSGAEVGEGEGGCRGRQGRRGETGDTQHIFVTCVVIMKNRSLGMSPEMVRNVEVKLSLWCLGYVLPHSSCHYDTFINTYPEETRKPIHCLYIVYYERNTCYTLRHKSLQYMFSPSLLVTCKRRIISNRLKAWDALVRNSIFSKKKTFY